MSSKNDAIKALRKLAGAGDSAQVTIAFATVTKVDASARTCDVTTQSTKQPIDLSGVLLMAASGDGILNIPAIDSTVIVGFSEQVVPFVMLFSDVDEIILICDKMSITLYSNKIKLGDGSLGGIPVQKLIQNNLNKIYDYVINGLVQNLQTALNSAGGGDASAGTTFLGAMQSFRMDFENMENKNITHGNPLA